MENKPKTTQLLNMPQIHTLQTQQKQQTRLNNLQNDTNNNLIDTTLEVRTSASIGSTLVHTCT